MNYERDTALAMLADGQEYLENLLQPIDSAYRCLAFRAGALAAAPSDHLFESLVSLGIRVDVSIAGGVFVDDQNLQLDYRDCEETLLPFYPNLKDARKISRQREEIVCVPLNHFYGSRREVTRQNISLARQQLKGQGSGPVKSTVTSIDPEPARPSRIGQAFEKLIKPVIKRKHFVSDTGRLNFPLMREMLASIRQRAGDSGLTQIPIVLTNHPKDIRDLPAIERFVGEAAQANDIEFITLTEIAAKIQSGEFEVSAAP